MPDAATSATTPSANELSLKRGIVTFAIQAALVAVGLFIVWLWPAERLSEDTEEGRLFALTAVGSAYAVLGLLVAGQARRDDKGGDFAAKQLGAAGGLLLLLSALSNLRLEQNPALAWAVVGTILFVGVVVPLTIESARWLMHRPADARD